MTRIWLKLSLTILVIGVMTVTLGLGGKGCIPWQEVYDGEVFTGSSGPDDGGDPGNGNTAPNPPQTPWCEGQSNPTNVIDSSPEFSAIYDDDNTSDTADYYEIEVDTASGFNGTRMWDSGKTGMTAINENTRCTDISYNGTALANSTTYYWRIRFWDNSDARGDWSTTQQFTTIETGGDYVWVANYGSGDVTRITKSTFTVDIDPIEVGIGPRAIAVDDTHVWVTNLTSNNVTCITKSDLTTTTIGTAAPYAVAVDDTYVWVANYHSDDVTCITKSNTSIADTIDVGTTPYEIAVDDAYVWVVHSGDDNVTRITKLDSSAITITVGTTPYGIAVDETHVWVANYHSDDVTCITKSDLTTTTIDVGNTPTGVAVDDTYVWVANLNSSDVTRITKSTFTVDILPIEVGTNPYGVAVDDTYVWVVNYNSNDVTRILKSDSSITTTAVGTGPISVGDMTGYTYDRFWGPAKMAPNAPETPWCEGKPNPDNVTDSSPEFSAIYDDDNTSDHADYYEIEVDTASGFNGTRMWDSGKTDNTDQTDEGDRCADITYPAAPTATALANSTTYYWRIRFWDNVTTTAGAWSTGPQEFTTASSWQGAVDGYVWIANYDSDNVSCISKSTGSVVDTIAVGSSPNGVAVDEDYVWVANYGSHNVTRITKSDTSITDTIAVGGGPYGIAVDETYVWTANFGSHTVTCITKSDITGPKGTIDVGTQPYGIAVDETYVWVANFGSNTVTRIDRVTLVTDTIAAGIIPWGIAVDEDYVWVANFATNKVTRITKSDINGPKPTIDVGTGPYGVAVDEDYVWVSNTGNNNVTWILKSDFPNTSGTIDVGTVGTIPYGVAVDEDCVWVVNNTITSVYSIWKSTKTVIDTIPVGTNPYSLGDMTGYAYDMFFH